MNAPIHYSKERIEEETKRYFQKVYLWMVIGLLVTAAVSWGVFQNEAAITFIFSNTIVFIGIILVQFALVSLMVFLMKKVSATVATLLFVFYAATVGLTFSVIFIVFTLGSIGQVFLICAGMFAALSALGFFTKKDLSGMGKFLFMALIGLIIASVINIFVQNSVFDFIISIIGVLLFSALTVYDTQKIKKMNIIGNEGTQEDHKEAIRGALTLYLDFINLFLYLLRLFGKRR